MIRIEYTQVFLPVKSITLELIMIWDEYEELISKTAEQKGYNQYELKFILDYSRALYNKSYPIIYVYVHLSKLTCVKSSHIISASNDSAKFYRTFYIAKRNSDEKCQIDEPLPLLREIQRWILDNILSHITVHPCAKAYCKNISIKDNARFHKGQDILVSNHHFKWWFDFGPIRAFPLRA